MNDDNRSSPVQLLWTSGWDSTYRLLDLVLVRKRPVQPYYMLDRKRRSAPVEMRTMEAIKEALAARSPEARALIGETVIFEAAEAPQDAEIKRSFERLKAKSIIGGQYHLLALMAKHRGLDRLELSVHVDDSIFKHLDGNVRASADGYELAETLKDPDLEMLRSFAFPILMMSKVDMEQSARRHGFADLMEMTWFCFTPDRKGRPCGTCRPCGFTISEGMGRRVPWVNRAKYHALAPVRPLTSWLRRHRVRSRLRSLLGQRAG